MLRIRIVSFLTIIAIVTILYAVSIRRSGFLCTGSPVSSPSPAFNISMFMRSMPVVSHYSYISVASTSHCAISGACFRQFVLWYAVYCHKAPYIRSIVIS